jgi:hypothetical protein
MATMLLSGDVVALQLTGRALRDVHREIRRDMGEENHGVLGRFIANTVRNSVSTVMRRSIEYRVDELRSVEYTRGRLVFTARDGDRVFEEVRINGTDVTAAFSPEDAHAFVREFRALKARTR